MNRIVLSWNSGGNWMQPNVLASHRDAARRWGAEYVSNMYAPEDPFSDKAKLLRGAEADRVVWLDGDAVVRYDCPSLFDCVAPDTFAGVPNFQGDTHDGDPWFYHECDWNYMIQRYGRMDLFYDPSVFINSGVIVFTPDLHREIWNDQYPIVPQGEQTMMNFRADMLGVNRQSLPYTFNRIGPQAWQPGGMSCFIQHLAAYRFKTDQRQRKDRDEALRAIDWTSKAEALVAAA